MPVEPVSESPILLFPYFVLTCSQEYPILSDKADSADAIECCIHYVV